MLLGLSFLVGARYVEFRATGSVNWLGLLIIDALFVCMDLARRAARAITTSPLLWLLAFAGSCTPLLMRPTPPGRYALAGDVLQAVGVVLIVAALLSLLGSISRTRRCAMPRGGSHCWCCSCCGLAPRNAFWAALRSIGPAPCVRYRQLPGLL